MASAREDDYQWFLDNRDSIINGHEGKSVIISSKRIIGYYANDEEAYNAAKKLNISSYIIQQCLPAEQTDLFYHTGMISFS